MTSSIMRVIYAKTGPMIYIAHLDTIEMLLRALRRAMIPYALTQGCHRRPKIQFGPPLPLGHSGLSEFFFVTLREEITSDSAKINLFNQFPKGISLREVKMVQKDEVSLATNRIQYKLQFQRGSERAINLVRRYLSDPDWHFDNQRKGTITVFRLGEAVQKIAYSSTEGFPSLEVDFIQGVPDVPSVSKVLTAVVDHLGDDREELVSLERTRFIDLSFNLPDTL